MIDLISKKVSFSEPELEDNGDYTGYIGLSIIPISKNSNQILTNLSFTKESDSSFEKTFNGIDLLDFSNSPEQFINQKKHFYELSLHKTGETVKKVWNKEFATPQEPNDDGLLIRTTDSDITETIESQESTYRIVELEEISEIPAYIQKHVLYKFNSYIQSIETILSCDLYAVKSDFLFTLFQNLGTHLKVNNSFTSLINLKSKSLTRNYTRSIPDYSIEIKEKDFIPFTDTDSIKYITTLSTTNISNYNYTIQVDNNFDFILLLPNCSKKSFSGSDQSFKTFKQLLLDGDINEINYTLRQWADSQRDFSDQFSEDLESFLNNFQKKVTQFSLKDSFSVMKDVKGIFNCNLLTEVQQ